MSGYIRFVLLVLVIGFGVWCFNTFAPEDFTKENMEATIKKEKTIQAVQQGRERRRYEEQRVMDQF